MGYDKRLDGRKHDELRPIVAKAGIIKNATGSAMFGIGNTVAYAAVYGPRDLHPKFLQNPATGIIRCHYNMMPFSPKGERVRPGTSRRSKEISYVTENALRPVLDLTNYPNSVVDVFIEFPQTDAGSRCAGICAASMALADAGVQMKDMVAAVAVGCINGTVVADLQYAEEAYEGDVADIPVAMTCNSDQVSLLQMDGPLDQKQLKEGLALAKKSIAKIYEIQKKALKEKYQGDEK